MTQRIFDVDNPQEIFDLFPDGVIRIEKSDREDGQDIIIFDDDCWDYTHIKINWRDKTEITRHADKSKWIGCLCWFVDDTGNEYIGVLHAIRNGDDSYPYVCKNWILRAFKNCRPVRRDEIKFVEDV